MWTEESRSRSSKRSASSFAAAGQEIE
jgi:hypothetical protein